MVACEGLGPNVEVGFLFSALRKFEKKLRVAEIWPHFPEHLKEEKDGGGVERGEWRRRRWGNKCLAEELGQHSYITSCFCIWQWSWRVETEREQEKEDVVASAHVACSLAYIPGYRPAKDITVKDSQHKLALSTNRRTNQDNEARTTKLVFCEPSLSVYSLSLCSSSLRLAAPFFSSINGFNTHVIKCPSRTFTSFIFFKRCSLVVPVTWMSPPCLCTDVSVCCSVLLQDGLVLLDCQPSDYKDQRSVVNNIYIYI